MDFEVGRGDEFGKLESQWAPEPAGGDEALVRARALAHATLVQTSMKVANIRAAAQSTLLDAHVQAEEVLAGARDEAENIRQEARAEAQEIAVQILAEAHHNAIAITDHSLDQGNMLLSATLEKISQLSADLTAAADQLIAGAQQPLVARSQLTRVIAALSDIAEKVEGVDAWGSLDRLASAGMAA